MEPVTVDVKRLDDVVPGDVCIDLMKIDAQSAEKMVLQGASETLQRTSVVVVEVSLYDMYETQTRLGDIESLLRDFRLYAVPFVSQNPGNLRTDWLECVYVRDSRNSTAHGK